LPKLHVSGSVSELTHHDVLQFTIAPFVIHSSGCTIIVELSSCILPG